MAKVKIAMIGAGSVVFARRLMCDILSFPELADSTITLMDIDQEKLALTTALGHKLVAQERYPATIESTLDRRRALEGADYVIIMIRIGGISADRPDMEIPYAYGVDQSVADTITPGGISRGLRTIPVMIDICHDMEALCPDALLINYTNPMAILCWAMNRATHIRNVGLCHSVQGTATRLANYIGAPYEEVSHWVAGINHMAWFLELMWKGQDAYPLLRRAMEDPATYESDKVRFEIMRRFGYFVTESSRHMSEYVPYFRKTPEMAEEWAPSAHSIRSLDEWMARHEQYYDDLRQQIASDEPFEFERTHEYCSRIIYAIETNSPYRINGNVQNMGQITNLPLGCTVEVPCLVDGAGLHPCHVGDLPPQLAALNRSNINVQEMAVKAGLEGDREAAFQAMALDPLTGALLTLDEIWRMTEELLQAQAEWLPQFG
jgi:alpha-galactosidase